MADRRTYPRERTSLGVECFSTTRDGTPLRMHGVTQDLSAGGVGFQTALWQGLEVGKTVNLRLWDLSAEPHRPGRARTACAWATVRRILVGSADSEAPAFASVAVEFNEKPFTGGFRLAG